MRKKREEKGGKGEGDGKVGDLKEWREERRTIHSL